MEHFISWLLTQKEKRTPTGKIARIGLKGRDLYGFKLETENDLITILNAAPITEVLKVKYLPRAKVSFKRVLSNQKNNSLKTQYDDDIFDDEFI